MANGYQVGFEEDPARFLERAGAHLAADPVVSTVVASIAQRMARASPNMLAAPYSWFAVVTGPDGAIAGAAMRTAPFVPYPPYLLAMPDGAARALADAVLDREEEVRGVNGALPASRVFADRVAERCGGSVEVTMHTRLFELGTLVDPRPVRGRLRPAYDDEAPLALEWFRRFHQDADEQAGHTDHPDRGETTSMDDVRDRIRRGRLWMWVDESDTPRHLTGANPPAFGVARIGPVFTPKEERGRGYASAAVAEVSRLLQAEGARVTLFTDQANPTSNRIYTALGFEPVVDMVELSISAGP
ncbi:GNAT family N-acetyltransferase [Nocardioides silvaticus]|uniref:GNAT family N-acetyltransferase n=1 Tax=Nocardioides silvaticus TaxID=2201891 RepID=A0A316TDN2_9ACTN|nr:GNAT family N-acetyltransferase [Nocardioides silvaticus]PWN01601.1 GNAT family N-acetyltransferase [Nocardioides silvaticus]